MNIYLIASESFRQINEEISKIIKDSKNVTNFDLTIDTLEDVLVEAGYFSMFQEEKFIIVRNANFFGTGKIGDKDSEMLLNYFNAPNSLSVLIFICPEKLDSRKKITKLIKEKYKVIDIPPLKHYEIENKVLEYLKKAKYQIDEESAKFIVANSLNNYDIALGEADKIMLYYKTPSKILFKDVQMITSKQINTNNFLFVDAVVEGDLKKALDLYHDLTIMKVDPTVLISLLARDYRILLEIKTMQENNKNDYEIMNTLGLQNWQYDRYLKKIFPFKKIELENILVKLSNTDLEIKSGKKDKFVALELLILDICS